MDTAVAATPRAKTAPKRKPLPFECIALTLQGGGALGAYQAGVCQALDEAGIWPDWVAGISIGAINAAIVAGNPPETRVAKLRQFWETVSANPVWGAVGDIVLRSVSGDGARRAESQANALVSATVGVPGFFAPRALPPSFATPGSPAATSYYDLSALKTTLERLVDFDRVNSGETRLSVGAVNLRSGNFTYFDTTTHRIRPEHIMASGALPPGFPAVEIDGEHYWDGGTVSNTPLQWVLQYGPRQDTLAFQVDLWSARGELPRNLLEVETRRKEILYSSRTRENTDRFKHAQRMRHTVSRLVARLPAEMRDLPEARFLREFGDDKVYSMVHLIYRPWRYEGYAKDFEFSRRSMAEHWQAGHADTVKSLSHPEVLRRPDGPEGLAVFDLTESGRG